MRSLCASDGWGHCILWFKEGQCANSYWHYWCRHFSQRLGVRIVGPPLIDIYKLNFCEVNEPLSSLFTPNSKDRNALNVLYLVCLIIGGNWLNFLTSLHRFNLENFLIYNIYSYTYICIAFAVEGSGSWFPPTMLERIKKQNVMHLQ